MTAKIITAMVAVIVIISFLIIFRDIVAPIFQVVLFSMAIIAILLALGVFIFLVHSAIEKMRKTSLERKSMQYQTHTDGFGMLYLVNVASGIIENLSAYPGSHRNGHWENPEPAAAAAWEKLLNKRSGESPVAYLMPPEQKPQLDLMTIMTQPTQSYSIIGGQHVGKTHVARKIASYWSMQSINNQMVDKPVLIAPKWDIGEWGDCDRVGGKYNYEQVMVGLNAVKKLAQKRHADENLSHKQHPIQAVFIDDWTPIRQQLGPIAEDFITEATVLYASVNIILYFILHADTNGAYGTDKIGAALHKNFYKLFIEPGYDSAGLVDRSKNIGWLQRPGQSQKDRQQVPLFTQTGRQVVTVEPDLVIPPTRITEREQKIMALHQAGLSDNEIAKEVYVGHGGNQVRRVREVIDKFALHIKP